MYLSAKKSVCGTEWASDKEKAMHKAVKDAVPEIFNSGNLNMIEVKFEVAYWSKANHIHQWFVNNCQYGEDNCQNTYVSIEDIQKLMDVCKQVLNTVETVNGEVHNGTTYYSDGKVVKNMEPGRVICQQKIAEDLLPTAQGFFFGGIDYDEYYLQSCERTVEMLEPLLTKLDGWEFEYYASW